MSYLPCGVLLRSFANALDDNKGENEKTLWNPVLLCGEIN